MSSYTRLSLHPITVTGGNLISDLMLSHQGGILTAGAFLTGPDAPTETTKRFDMNRLVFGYVFIDRNQTLYKGWCFLRAQGESFSTFLMGAFKNIFFESKWRYVCVCICIHLHTDLHTHLCTYRERKEGRRRKNPPKYAAWLVDSASPSLRRSFPASPGVEQWAGELSSMKFLLLDVLMVRGGRSTLMTVCRSSCTSGCSSHGLSGGQSSGEGSGKKSKSPGRLSTSDTEQLSSLSDSRLAMRVFPPQSTASPTDKGSWCCLLHGQRPRACALS